MGLLMTTNEFPNYDGVVDAFVPSLFHRSLPSSLFGEANLFFQSFWRWYLIFITIITSLRINVTVWLCWVFQGFGICQEDKTLTIKVCRAKGLQALGLSRDADPFVIITCNNKEVKTTVQRNTLNPIWNETFIIHFSNPNDVVRMAPLGLVPI